jgi:multidrug efflux pump subunit AcrA (membrane-fusion protein)
LLGVTTPGQDADLAQLQTSVAELQALLREERARAEAERLRTEAERAASKQRIAALEKERDNLLSSHERLRHELELFRRRLFIAKAERSNDAGQLELEFAEKLRELDALAGTLGIANDRPKSDDTPARDGKPRGKRTNNRGTGRRDLKALGLEQERIEIPDPRLEALVAQGKVVPHGFEENFKSSRTCRSAPARRLRATRASAAPRPPDKWLAA